MEDLKSFYQLESLGQSVPPGSSFARRSNQEVERHFLCTKYGEFFLPDAIRPSFDLQIIPRQGFRKDEYTDDCTGEIRPVIRAAVSRERLLDVFYDSLSLLGDTANVILENSHADEQLPDNFHYYYREVIDIPVLKSILMDYEDFLLSDGCTGLAAMHCEEFLEIHLDEHKLLVLYAEDAEIFDEIFIRNQILHDPQMPLITDAEHVHVTRDKYQDLFRQLAQDLQMEAY